MVRHYQLVMPDHDHFPLSFGGLGARIGEVTTIFFPMSCIQELIKKWVQQIEHPTSQIKIHIREGSWLCS